HQYYLHHNEELLNVHCKLQQEIIPQDWQTLTFIETINQAEQLSGKLKVSHKVAIAELLKKIPGAREKWLETMSSGEVKRCLATGVYSQRVTFSDLRVMINACGGSASISSIQKPVRLVEISPNKKRGYMIDFLYHMESPEWEYDK